MSAAAALPEWLVIAWCLIGAGVSLAAGLCAMAGLLWLAWLVLSRAFSDLVAWRDLRQAVDEWKQRHPDKAARYDSHGPWRTW